MHSLVAGRSMEESEPTGDVGCFLSPEWLQSELIC